ADVGVDRRGERAIVLRQRADGRNGEAERVAGERLEDFVRYVVAAQPAQCDAAVEADGGTQRAGDRFLVERGELLECVLWIAVAHQRERAGEALVAGEQ